MSHEAPEYTNGCMALTKIGVDSVFDFGLSHFSRCSDTST